MENLPIILIFILSYLSGSIPFGLLIAKFKGVDIRKKGSGNIGATNVVRNIGKSWGILCFILDFLKGAVPVILMKFYLLDWQISNILQPTYDFSFIDQVLLILASFIAICGHVFPVWLKFKGGKGIATGGGAIFTLIPLVFLIAFFIWYLVMKISGYSSLGSIIAAMSLPITLTAMYYLGLMTEGVIFPLPIFLLTLLLAILLIFTHKDNIVRIIKKDEYSFKK